MLCKGGRAATAAAAAAATAGARDLLGFLRAAGPFDLARCPIFRSRQTGELCLQVIRTRRDQPTDSRTPLINIMQVRGMQLGERWSDPPGVKGERAAGVRYWFC